MAMTILIVDDNEFIRTSMTKFLGSAGFEAMAVPSGQEALAMLSDYNSPVSIVITDVVMPGMDGFDVVDEINNHRKIGRRLGLVAMSGGGQTIDAKTALDALDGQVDVYLRKPFQQNELKTALEDVIIKYDLDRIPSKKKQSDYWEV